MQPLPKTDPRSEHILEVLKVELEQTFDVGLINGPRGKAKLLRTDKESIDLEFEWREETPELYPIDLWISFCRPQTCRRVLQECTSMGVQSITLFDTEKSEPSYRKSRLWSTDEAHRLLVRGAEQAFCTRIPELKLKSTMEESIRNFAKKGTKLALDNYEATTTLDKIKSPSRPVTLAVGGERGWSSKERVILREAGFVFADLGQRVLRTETACIAAISILRTRLGC